MNEFAVVDLPSKANRETYSAHVLFLVIQWSCEQSYVTMANLS